MYIFVHTYVQYLYISFKDSAWKDFPSVYWIYVFKYFAMEKMVKVIKKILLEYVHKYIHIVSNYLH